MAEEEEGHAGCDDQADHVVADFYFKVFQKRVIFYDN